MRNIIYRWLAPPIFDDDGEATRRAALLNTILLGGILFLLLLISGMLLGSTIKRSVMLIDLILVVVFAFIRRWLMAGRVARVAISMLLIGWIGITLVNIQLGTIRTPTSALYLFWILVAGAVYRLKGLVAAVLTASLSIGGLIMAENAGRLPMPEYSVSVTQWLTYTTLFALSAALTYHINELTRRALAQAELEVARREHTEVDLVATKNRLQGMLDALPDLLFEVDAEGTIYDCRSPRADLLGSAPEAFLGKKFSDMLPKQAAGVIAAALQQAASSGNSTGSRYSLALPMGVRWFDLSVALKPGIEEGSRRFICLARDVTERKADEDELIQIREALKRQNDKLQGYAAELEATNQKLNELAITDGLTGLANRRRFDEVLVAESSRSRRSGNPLAILMIDIDDFKKYNDHYGHQAGDECLAKVANALQFNARRHSDFVSRYGGEEFTVIVADSDLEEVRKLAEAIQNSVAALAIPHVESPFGRVTISLGIAVGVPDQQRDADALLRSADAALYQAKDAGRNRIHVAPETLE